MTNSAITREFFRLIDTKTSCEILTSVAKHYGISVDEALAELLNDEAEHLLEYLTGTMRSATSVLMQRHGLR